MTLFAAKAEKPHTLTAVVNDDVVEQAMLAALRVMRARLGIQNDGSHARAFMAVTGDEYRALMCRYIAREADAEAAAIEKRLSDGGKK